MAAKKRPAKKRPAEEPNRGSKPTAKKRDQTPSNTLPVAQLETMAAPYNPRLDMAGHEFEALRHGLATLGVLDPIIVNRRTKANGWPAKSAPVIVGGHQRIRAAVAEGMESFPVYWVDLDEDEEQEANIALNQIRGRWHDEALAQMVRGLKGRDRDLSTLGFEDKELQRILRSIKRTEGQTSPDSVPKTVPKRVKLGDFWQLGEHVLGCGDTTDPKVVRKLMRGALAAMIHADPPYGMGKEADGVTNDNLYREKLDAFQMAWWHAWRQQTNENGSAYIWGNPSDLWRLWYNGPLCEEPEVMFRNEIVWDKGNGFGMLSDGMQSYSVATERCLFLMLGQQFIGNQNVEDYWEGYEPLRAWLVEQRDKAGWKNAQVNKITSSSMAGHWFSKSQFQIINEENYELLREAAKGEAFVPSYGELFEQFFPGSRAGGNAHRRDLAAEIRSSRTYFNNLHDTMSDVWRFPRVSGEERFGHATPKPVAMMERAITTSSDNGDIVAAPFGGTGPEFIACERLGRKCRGLEIEPEYCDIIIARWEAFTGSKAKKLGRK